ncbi:unnamed protein product [Urochloa decumbens]|uniref:Uncharacterized protein n=1 Tax=Urochloa decumbens TaxID=240449 RepID=A0ABC9ENU8_9POAL
MVAFHLRATLSRILRSPSRLPTSPYAPPLVSPHRHSLLSYSAAAAAAAAAASSSGSFAVEDYLVSRLGLTPAQAHKAAASLRNYPTSDPAPSPKPYSPTSTAPSVSPLPTSGGPSSSNQGSSAQRFLRSKLEFCLAELGSFDKLLQVFRWHASILSAGLDKIARPNVAFLRQYGLNISDNTGASICYTRLFTMNPEVLKEAVQRVEELGINCGVRMLRQALPVVAFTDKDVLAKRIRLLHNTGFSKDDVLTVAKKQPDVLGLSEPKLQGNLDFLMKDVGLEVSYIVRRPVLLKYSVERRLLPRHWLLKVLKEKGLLKFELGYYGTAKMAEKEFVEKFVHPFKNRVPGLANDYASKCLGKAAVGVA